MAVGQNRAALRDHGLLAVAGRELVSEAFAPPFFEGGEDIGVKDHTAPEDRGDRRFGHVVGGGAESAGGDHGARALEGVLHGAGDGGGVITAGGTAHDAHAERG